MGKFIIDNAIISWKDAIKDCNQILTGKVSLKYRKQFVSSLHNSVELFAKQYLMDGNDKNSLGHFYKEENVLQNKYNDSDNLNLFFSSLKENELNKFKTKSFNTLKTIIVECISEKSKADTGDQGINVVESLNLLQKLRNQETHFSINDLFLTEEEFCKLHNFMIYFFKYFIQGHVFSSAWGDLSFRSYDLKFEKKALSNFSYKDVLKNSKSFKLLNELVYDYDLFDSDYLYDIICDICLEESLEIEGNEFDNLYETLVMCVDFGISKIEKICIEDECNGYIEKYSIEFM